MHFCPYCGQGNEDGAANCVNCGKPIPGAQQYTQQNKFEHPPVQNPYAQQNPNSFGNPYDPHNSGPAGYTPPESPMHANPSVDATVFGDPSRFGSGDYGSPESFDPNRWSPMPPPVPQNPPAQPADGKKKTVLIVILALIVILLVGSIVGVLLWHNSKDDEEESSSEEVTVAAVSEKDAPANIATTKNAPTTAAATTAVTTTAPNVVISVPPTMVTTLPAPPQTQPPQQVVGYEQAQINFCSFYASYINAMNAQTRSGIVLCSSEVAESMYSRMSLNSKSRFTLNYIDFDLDTFKALSGSRVQYIVRCHSTVYDRSSGAYKDVIDARWNVVSTYDAAAGVFNVTSMTRNDSIVFGSRYDRYTP